jgi:hypothetical protein
MSRGERDPHGKSQHESGAKMDDGKMRPWLVLGGFSKALEEVSRVGTYGARKYTDDGWRDVPDGFRRYSEAMLRHQLAEMGREKWDRESNLLHAAHVAWNALARLELILVEQGGVEVEVERQ